MSLIPPIGTAGIYTLQTPFNSHLQQNVSYRCEAVRKISDFVEVGLDPYDLYYRPVGITEQKYAEDLLNSVCIVSLQSESGHWVYVPSSYITAYPNINGVPYRVIVLGVELGALPEYMDLTALKVSVSNVVRDTIGVTPDIKEVAISALQNISQYDHDTLTQTRAYLVTNSNTDRAKLLDLQARFATLQADYDTLVKTMYLPTP